MRVEVLSTGSRPISPGQRSESLFVNQSVFIRVHPWFSSFTPQSAMQRTESD
jgi:hypothetical protein